MYNNNNNDDAHTIQHDGIVLQLIAVRGGPSDCTSIDVFVSSSGMHVAFTDVPISRDGCMSGPPLSRPCPTLLPNDVRITACKPNGEQLGQAVGLGCLQLSPTLTIHLEPTTTKQQPTPDELRVAYELEQWRAAQQRRCLAQLEQHAAAREAALQAEWDAREQQRVGELQVARQRCVLFCCIVSVLMLLYEEQQQQRMFASPHIVAVLRVSHIIS